MHIAWKVSIFILFLVVSIILCATSDGITAITLLERADVGLSHDNRALEARIATAEDHIHFLMSRLFFAELRKSLSALVNDRLRDSVCNPDTGKTHISECFEISIHVPHLNAHLIADKLMEQFKPDGETTEFAMEYTGFSHEDPKNTKIFIDFSLSRKCAIYGILLDESDGMTLSAPFFEIGEYEKLRSSGIFTPK